MARSLLQTTNQSTETIAVNGIIPLGSVLRRFGCNIKLSGNAIEISGEGYYTIDCDVTISPTAAGVVSVALYKDGVQIPSAIASGYVAEADSPVTLPITTTIRQRCCENVNNITCVLLEGPGTLDNISTRSEKK